jgi:thioredoxin-related protein
MKNIIKVGVIILAFTFALSLKANAEEIKFEKGTFKEVLAKAKSENKILMIDFFTDWCKWCVELDKKVYTDKDVADFANTKQINWKVDAEKGEGQELAKKYAVSGYPTIVFLDGNGDEVDRIVGYIPAKDFLKKIKEFNEGVNTYGSIVKVMSNNPDDVKANYLMGERIIVNENDYKKAEPYLKKVITLDTNNSSGYKTGAILYLAIGSGDIERIKKFIVDYPKSEKCKSAYIALSEKYYNDNVDFMSAKSNYDKAFEIYGKSDEELNSSYIQYLLTYMIALSKNENEEDWRKGLDLSNECMVFAKGSVNEGSVYYLQAIFYNNLKDKDNANTAIDKALQIRDAKAFRELKEKINQ